MNNKKKRAVLGPVSFVIYVVMGIIIGFRYVITSFNDDAEPGNLLVLYFVLFAGLCVAIYINVIVHESGHLVFGVLSGYRFSSFRVGIFAFVKKDSGGYVLRLMRVPGTAGQCLLSPPEPEGGLIPQALYNLGGVIMNITVSVIMLALSIWVIPEGNLNLFVFIMAITGFALALINGIPMRSALICNDGMNAFYARRPEANRALYNILSLSEYQTKGYRMKDMPEELFRFPDAEGFKYPLTASEAVFVIQRVMDNGYLGNASELIDLALREGEGLLGVYRKLLLSDRLFVSLMAGRKAEYIESIFDKELKQSQRLFAVSPSGVYSVYAYEKLYRGDLVKADEIRKRFIKAAKRYPYKGELETAVMLMDRVDEQWNIWNKGPAENGLSDIEVKD